MSDAQQPRDGRQGDDLPREDDDGLRDRERLRTEQGGLQPGGCGDRPPMPRWRAGRRVPAGEWSAMMRA